MNKICFFFLCFLLHVTLYSQETRSNPYGEKYKDPQFNGLKIVNIIDKIGFKPFNRTNDMTKFKTAILQLSDKAYAQLNIDTWYYCSLKHEEYYQIYNLNFKPITRDIYDENCKAIIALMLIDGVVTAK